jgi:trk system potassium uptake protein TrkH
MNNKKIVINILGKLLFFESFFMLSALLVCLLYKESDTMAFLYSFLLTFASALVLTFGSLKKKADLRKHEGYIIVSLVWVVFSIFGSLPYIFSNAIPAPADAFFETMSGFTTTGSSILNNIEELSHGILFWRSLTQWLGGMGIIVLFLAILPKLGIGGRELFIAEVPGPAPDKLTPSIAATARKLWGLYVIFTLIETILLYIGGMNFFDAINHSFTTMATGGYSTKQASIAYYDSAFIQYIIILFMFIAGTNFSLSYSAIIGKPIKLFKDEEFKFYCLIICGVSALIAIGLFFEGSDIEASIRDSIFTVISIITTTGFATVDYELWSPFLKMLILALMFIGGSAGSTGGGIKVVRILLLIKNSYYELKRLVHPNAVINVKYNKHRVSSTIITNVMAFLVLYTGVFLISIIIMSTCMPNLDSAISCVATTLGNIGPGFGNIGPTDNFALLPSWSKWFLSFLMLLGRLELFTVLILFTKAFWKK